MDKLRVSDRDNVFMTLSGDFLSQVIAPTVQGRFAPNGTVLIAQADAARDRSR
jgi:hypothetical protein